MKKIVFICLLVIHMHSRSIVDLGTYVAAPVAAIAIVGSFYGVYRLAINRPAPAVVQAPAPIAMAAVNVNGADNQDAHDNQPPMQMSPIFGAIPISVHPFAYHALQHIH